MYPALSVIFFTVLSGAGFGLMALIGLGFVMPEGALAAFFISAIAIGLVATGLLSSLLHLGHPERAIKSLSQWRSSWLSREGVAAIATLLLFSTYALNWMIMGERNLILGMLVALVSVFTIFATAMIYAQLRTVPHWYSILTPICYLASAAMSGLFIAVVISGVTLGEDRTMLAVLFVVILMVAAIKAAWWNRADRTTLKSLGLDAGSATGLNRIGRTRLLEKPHSGENYLTKEMVFRVARKHARKLRLIAMLAAFAFPILMVGFVALTASGPIWLVMAIVVQLIGLLVERWLFFAEAQHAVSLYY